MDVLLGLVRVITLLVLLLISCVDAGPSPTLPNPYFCFRDNPQSPCVPSVEYPLERAGWSSYSCGYPGFEVDCNLLDDGKAFINISNHIYYVLEVDYKFKTIRLVEKHLLCSEVDTNTSPSYAFYDYETLTRQGFDWYGNCAQNVVVPHYVGNTGSASATIKRGFSMTWSATDWCEDCERSGGRCWSIHNSTATGCACENYQSYNRTCTPKTPPPHQGLSTGLKIGTGMLSGIGGVLLVALLVFCKRSNHSSLSLSHWWNKKKSPINIEVFLEKYGCLTLQRYKYSDIRKMTNSFKDTLGQGGYGRVFKGELPDGRLVAIKLLNESKGDGEDFINEVATIGRTNHVNVVNLVGFCIEGIHRALVYEFMPNGSLERFIYSERILNNFALGLGKTLPNCTRHC